MTEEGRRAMVRVHIEHEDKWDRRFFDLALRARTWVKGPDLGVGACAVSPDRRLLALGYSGLPRRRADTDARITNARFKDHNLVHAELNAILNASSHGSLRNWTMYATTHPCARCAAALIQTGFVRVVCPRPVRDSRWYESHLEARDAFDETGVTVKHMKMETAA